MGSSRLRSRKLLRPSSGDHGAGAAATGAGKEGGRGGGKGGWRGSRLAGPEVELRRIPPAVVAAWRGVSLDQGCCKGVKRERSRGPPPAHPRRAATMPQFSELLAAAQAVRHGRHHRLRSATEVVRKPSPHTATGGWAYERRTLPSQPMTVGSFGKIPNSSRHLLNSLKSGPWALAS